MARKKKHPEHINHERWLVSYADFITLLFAFFVVMFAVSQVDSKKVGRFTESFSKAVGVDIFPQPGKGIMPGVASGMPSADADPSSTSALPAELDGLQASLTKTDQGEPAASQGVQVIARRHELVLRLADGLLFDSGNDALREPAILVLQKLAVELKKRNVDVRVEGHTDSRPIRNGRFRSNWDLSTSRATAVVSRLAMEGIPAKKLSAAGYGEFHPLEKNDTEDGRRKNRRVDLIVSLTPKDAVEVTLKEAEPTPAPKKAPEHKADPEDKPAPHAEKEPEPSGTKKKADDEEEPPKPVAKSSHPEDRPAHPAPTPDETPAAVAEKPAPEHSAEKPHPKPSHEEHEK